MIAERNGIEFTEDMNREQKTEAVINHYIEEYSSEYGHLSPEVQKQYAKIEMVADYVGGFLFTGESYEVNAKNLAIGDFEQDTDASLNAINEIANEDRGFIRMILDFFKDLKTKISMALGRSGKTVAADLERAEQYLETVYKNAETKVDTKTTNDVKYSKSNIFNRANIEGELVNEFYDALSKSEWAAYYNKIAESGALKEYAPGDVFITSIGGKLIISKVKMFGNDRFDYQVVMAFEEVSKDGINVDFVKEQLKAYNLTAKEIDNYGQKYIYETINRLVRLYDASSFFKVYDRSSNQFSGSFTNSTKRTILEKGKRSNYKQSSGKGLSSSGQPNLERIGTVGNKESKINTELTEASDEGAFSLPKNEKASVGVPVSDKTDAEYLELAKNPEKNDRKLNELVDEAAEKAMPDTTVRKKDGSLRVVYHGRTSKFNVFERNFANIEGDFGKGYYFSSDYQDSANNYGEEGQDITNKIAREAERIEAESDGKISYERAKEIARDKYITSEENVIECYLDIKNPVIITPNEQGTFLDYEVEYDEETDEYGEPQGGLIDFIEALKEEAASYAWRDVDFSFLYYYGMDNGGMYAADAVKVIKEHILDELTDENGDIAVNEVVRAAFENMGYDGIIDSLVSYKFNSMNLGRDTTHYIAFNSEQIKLADPVTYDDEGNVIPLSERFNSENNDIRRSKGIPVPTLRYNTEEFAKSLIRKAQSTIDVEDVTEQLKEIVKAYNKFDTERANNLISRLTLRIAEYQKPVREWYEQEYLDNLKGETIRVYKEDMGDIYYAGDTLRGLKDSTGIKFVISETEAREWLAEKKGEKIPNKTAFKNLCRKYGIVIDNYGKYSSIDTISEIGVNVDEDSTDMSPIEQLKNRSFERFLVLGLQNRISKRDNKGKKCVLGT